MITIKSNREIELMIEAGRITALAHRKVKEAIRPGISTLELDKIAEETIRACGATPSFKGYNGFPGSICASINNVVIHGIPKQNIILKDGDIISVDIGACYKGYHGDSAMTHGVGNVSEHRKRLMRVTKESLYKGLEMAKPGNRLSDISHAIESYVNAHGYSVVRDFTGHGVGRNLHEDPAIPNYGEAGHGPILKPGMTLAIEPMVNAGKHYVRILADDWTTVTADHSDSAHFEHSILITEDGYKILTVEEDS
ncbi:MAG: type I methionyl aminopeptidase [Coprobacillus sp. 28_7]|nr:MAG: type I methionyl aminopeptidase [Coprobacillus sp. 28_7]CCY08445.1 methionine aminopeptidase [Coprobacillus sp. CAG:698]